MLRGIFAPITYTIGFLNYDCGDAVQKYIEWQSPIQKKRGVTLESSHVSGSLADALQHLLPLTSVERRRFLFLPTSGTWTAFFDNGYQGTDAFAPLSYLAEALKCSAVRATAVPDSNETHSFGATILEIYGPRRTEFLNYIRSIAVAYDGRAWSFSAAGEVQPFEQTERYQSRSIQERFTPEMLDAYLQAMGIRAFDDGFYAVAGPATLVEKIGPIAPAAKEFQLADVRG
jgi:hypothetical protein